MLLRYVPPCDLHQGCQGWCVRATCVGPVNQDTRSSQGKPRTSQVGASYPRVQGVEVVWQGSAYVAGRLSCLILCKHVLQIPRRPRCGQVVQLDAGITQTARLNVLESQQVQRCSTRKHSCTGEPQGVHISSSWLLRVHALLTGHA